MILDCLFQEWRIFRSISIHKGKTNIHITVRGLQFVNSGYKKMKFTKHDHFCCAYPKTKPKYLSAWMNLKAKLRGHRTFNLIGEFLQATSWRACVRAYIKLCGVCMESSPTWLTSPGDQRRVSGLFVFARLITRAPAWFYLIAAREGGLRAPRRSSTTWRVSIQETSRAPADGAYCVSPEGTFCCRLQLRNYVWNVIIINTWRLSTFISLFI